MRECKEEFLFEFLIFSKDIEQDITDFRDEILNMDISFLVEEINYMKNENIYTKENIENLKKVVEFLKEKIPNYEELIQILDNVKPSYDVYYYEYLDKFEVIKDVNYEAGMIEKKIIEDSVRYDFYAYMSLVMDYKNYKQILQHFIMNTFYPLFVQKLLNDQPGVLKNKKMVERICEVLEYNINNLVNPVYVNHNKRLLKEVKYFNREKNAQTFDYRKFEFHRNKSFIEYIITSNVDLNNYHDYLISDYFIDFLRLFVEMYDPNEELHEFVYDEKMKKRFKYVLDYILNYRQDNWYKITYNIMLTKWNSYKPKEEMEFYQREAKIRNNHLETLLDMDNPQFLKTEMKMSLMYDCDIWKFYASNDDDYVDSIPEINLDMYLKWIRKMLKTDYSFFQNPFLKNRTLAALNFLERDEYYRECKKTVEKIKRKIKNLNRELEY